MSKEPSAAVKPLSEVKALLSDTYAGEPELIPFRGESAAAGAWRCLCRRVGVEFLSTVLLPSLLPPNDAVGSRGSHRTEDSPEEEAGKVLNRCFASVDLVHPHVREALAAAVASPAGAPSLGKDGKKRRLALRNLFFLRYLVCSCVNPSGWDLVDEETATSLPLQNRWAAVGRAVGLAVSDVTASSAAVQIFLDRLVDTSSGLCNPLDLRHFLAATQPIGRPSAASRRVSVEHAVFKTPKRAPSSPLVSPTKKDKKHKKGSFGNFRSSSSPTSLDCFRLIPSEVATPSLGGALDSSPRAPFGVNVAELGVRELGHFLFERGLVDLIDVFTRNAIDGKRLLQTTESDFIALGLTSAQRANVWSALRGAMGD